MPAPPSRGPSEGRGELMPWMPQSHYQLSRFAAARHTRYAQQHPRDPAIVRFYSSTAWRSLRLMKLAASPICENNPCTDAAVDVHHRTPIKVDMSRALEYANLQSVCRSCHKLVEPPGHFLISSVPALRSVPDSRVSPQLNAPGVS